MIATLNTAKNLLRVSLCPCPGRPSSADPDEWNDYVKEGGLTFMQDGASKPRKLIKGAALTPPLNAHARAHTTPTNPPP